MQVDLADRVALVVGGGGLGALLRDALAANGAAVVAAAAGDADGADLSLDRADSGSIAAILARFGRLDLLVHADPLEAAPVEALLRSAARPMAAHRFGRMVMILPPGALMPIKEMPPAGTDPAALVALTKRLAMAFGADGVLVNAVATGAVADGDAVAHARLVSHSALGRPGSLAEIVAAALFLLDPANSYTTGHVLAADGGWSAGYARNF